MPLGLRILFYFIGTRIQLDKNDLITKVKGDGEE